MDQHLNTPACNLKHPLASPSQPSTHSVAVAPCSHLGAVYIQALYPRSRTSELVSVRQREAVRSESCFLPLVSHHHRSTTGSFLEQLQGLVRVTQGPLISVWMCVCGTGSHFSLRFSQRCSHKGRRSVSRLFEVDG